MQKIIHRKQLASLIGDEALRDAEDHDSIDGVRPQLIVSPETAEQAAQILAWASKNGVAVAPRGGGSKRGWGNSPARLDLILETGRLNQLIEHASGDMTATAQAGCTIASFQQKLAEQQQFLAVDPLWPFTATLGGVIATNDTGGLRLRYGGIRDQLIGVTIALPDGTVARSGGKVVKNVAGYDLQKLMTGALGTLGLIVEMTFRLYPHATAVANMSTHFDSIEAAHTAMLAVLDSALTPAAMQLVLDQGSNPRLDIRFEGLPEGIAAQIERTTHLTKAVFSTSDDTIWLERERLWDAPDHEAEKVIAKLSLLPTEIPAYYATLERLAEKLRLQWASQFYAQGLGSLKLQGANEELLLAALIHLRESMAKREGSLNILQCSQSLKQRLSVWADAGNALPLMRRVKQYFDPQAVLNPGRFVGNI